MKNITLSADGTLIEKARGQAEKEHRSLNAVFREWLESYVRPTVKRSYSDFVKTVSDARSGKKFTRDEMNER